MSDRRLFTITKVRRDDDGVWHARVTVDGVSSDVDTKHGVWRIVPDHEGDVYRHVLPFYAQALQDRIRPITNAERIAREKLRKSSLTPAERQALLDELLALDARARGITVAVNMDQHDGGSISATIAPKAMIG